MRDGDFIFQFRFINKLIDLEERDNINFSWLFFNYRRLSANQSHDSAHNNIISHIVFINIDNYTKMGHLNFFKTPGAYINPCIHLAHLWRTESEKTRNASRIIRSFIIFFSSYIWSVAKTVRCSSINKFKSNLYLNINNDRTNEWKECSQLFADWNILEN